MAHHRPAAPPPGPAVDARGIPAQDPTANVIAVVGAANKSLRRELKLHMMYQAKLAKAESQRINAIRAVDVAAVATARGEAEQRATALATQVLGLADTLRTQVATTAATGETNSRTALQPMQDDIRALRDAQSAFVGAKVADTDPDTIALRTLQLWQAQQSGVQAQKADARQTGVDMRTFTFALAGLILAIITAAALIGAHL